MPDLDELRDAFLLRTDDGVANLSGYDAAATPFVDGKSEAKDELDDDLDDELFDQHELLFANRDRSMLLVLQGLDCSGKNGTIKHVVIRMNPAGVRTASFTQPTEEERKEHFLDRHRRELPPPGFLGVFDRSHYEDVLVPLATGSEDRETIDERMSEIIDFEQELVGQDTIILKCMLHISYDEQRDRFLRRLRRDDKRWKFDPSDVDTRRRWDAYQAAYSEVLAATSTDDAPWYVIPSDRKWYRNWAVAQLIVNTLGSLNLAYPQPDFDVEALRADLQPPH